MLKEMRKKRNQKGFTLIELMIVIAIIGILAAIAIPNFIAYKKNAKDVSARATAKNAYTAAMAYLADNPSAEWATLTIDQIKVGGFRDTNGVVTTKGAGAGSQIASDPVGGAHAYAVTEAGSIIESDDVDD